jgi:hypothetical protein
MVSVADTYACQDFLVLVPEFRHCLALPQSHFNDLGRMVHPEVVFHV